MKNTTKTICELLDVDLDPIYNLEYPEILDQNKWNQYHERRELDVFLLSCLRNTDTDWEWRKRFNVLFVEASSEILIPNCVQPWMRSHFTKLIQGEITPSIAVSTVSRLCRLPDVISGREFHAMLGLFLMFGRFFVPQNPMKLRNIYNHLSRYGVEPLLTMEHELDHDPTKSKQWFSNYLNELDKSLRDLEYPDFIYALGNEMSFVALTLLVAKLHRACTFRSSKTAVDMVYSNLRTLLLEDLL